MTNDPVKRFLGVGVDADAATLLGVPLGRGTRSDIERALQKSAAARVPPSRRSVVRWREGAAAAPPRGAAVDSRSCRMNRRDDVLAAASSAPGRVVREERESERSARAACGAAPPRRGRTVVVVVGPCAVGAGERRAAPRRGPHVHHELTEFDRLVLAILIGAGGWNAESRQRLVAVASAHGVGVDGLMTVIRGLAAMGAAGRAGGRSRRRSPTGESAHLAFPGTDRRGGGDVTPVDADRASKITTERLARASLPRDAAGVDGRHGQGRGRLRPAHDSLRHASSCAPC